MHIYRRVQQPNTADLLSELEDRTKPLERRLGMLDALAGRKLSSSSCSPKPWEITQEQRFRVDQAAAELALLVLDRGEPVTAGLVTYEAVAAGDGWTLRRTLA